MTLHEHLNEIKERANKAKGRFPESLRMGELKNDIDRLLQVIEKLREQRDGYRTNYWSFSRCLERDKIEIKEDDDAECAKIWEEE